MTLITKNFSGIEDAATRIARLRSIYDFWFGAGAFATDKLVSGRVRQRMNAFFAEGIIDDQAFGTWMELWNRVNAADQYISTILSGAGPNNFLLADDTARVFGPDGVTAVSVPGTAVSLAADDWEGLELGAENTTLADFTAISNTTLSAPGGSRVATSVGAGTFGMQRLGFVSSRQNKPFLVDVTWSGNTAGSIGFDWGTVYIVYGSGASGRLRVVVFASSGADFNIYRFSGLSGGLTFTIDAVSVREVLNWPAYQNTPAARPTWGRAPAAVRNLARPSQLNVAGTELIVDNQTATFVGASAVLNDDTITQGVAPFYQRMPAGYLPFLGSHSASITQRRVKARIRTFGDNITGVGNINGGPAPTNVVGLPVTAAEGWKWVTFDLSGTISLGLRPTGTTSDWGLATIQIEAGAVDTPYQRRIGTSTPDITETGVRSFGLLSFDGSDDAVLHQIHTGGTVAVALFGRGGSFIIPSVVLAAADVLSIGPLSVLDSGVIVPGCPTGILRAVGTVPWSSRFELVGAAIMKANPTAEERARVMHYFAAHGARGWLSLGANEILNGDFAGAVAGTPGTAPTSWNFNSSDGSISVPAAGQIGFSVTSGRQIIGQTRIPSLAKPLESWKVTLVANPNGLTFHQLMTVINPTGTVTTYLANGTVVVHTSYVPVPGDVMEANLQITGATSGLTFRMGAGASSTATGSATFSTAEIRAYTPEF